jgi:hypothetical protein
MQGSGTLVRMGLLLRVAGALVLAVVAVSSPVMGWAAAEHYESRKFYRVFEGDWFFLFAFIGGGCCIWAATSLLRSIRRPPSS